MKTNFIYIETHPDIFRNRTCNVLRIIITVLCYNIYIVTAQSQNWTLQQCIDTALKNNLTIQQSANTTAISKITLNQSKSNLLPSLSGDVGQSYDLENSNSSNISLSSSVTLFNGFQNKNSIKQNQYEYESYEYDTEDKKNTITLNIVNAYLQILYAEELVKNSESQLDAVQLQVDNIEEFVNVGKKSESDLLQIKSEMASDKLSFINAEGQLRSAKLNLQQIMNIKTTKDFDIEYPLIAEPSTEKLVEADEIYLSALTIQPIIKSYELKTKSAIYGLKKVRGSNFPRLSLSGNIGTNYINTLKITKTSFQNEIQNIGYLQSDPNEVVLGNVSVPVYNNLNYPFNDQVKDNLSKSLSLSLTIPIYNNHQAKNNIAIQEISLKNSMLEEQNSKNELRKTIEEAYTNVENSLAKYNAAKEQEAASKSSYENAKTKYENGMLSMSDLLQELNAYSKAQSENTQARYELIYNIKILDYYKGVPLIF